MLHCEKLPSSGAPFRAKGIIGTITHGLRRGLLPVAPNGAENCETRTK